MKAIFCSAAVAALLSALSVGPCSASTVTDPDVPGSFVSGNAFNNTTGSSVSFTDFYIVDPTFEFDITFTAVTPVLSKAVTSLVAELFSGTPTGPHTPVGGAFPIADLPATLDDLSAGDYYLQITGGEPARSKSSYADEIDISAAPIPGTLALFVTGLGFIGLLAWNRGRKGDAVRSAVC
jgi:hypothetical protein